MYTIIDNMLINTSNDLVHLAEGTTSRMRKTAWMNEIIKQRFNSNHYSIELKTSIKTGVEIISYLIKELIYGHYITRVKIDIPKSYFMEQTPREKSQKEQMLQNCLDQVENLLSFSSDQDITVNLKTGLVQFQLIEE